ncbi:MAG: hypothetical protein H0W62_15115 [Chitinophagales bacterium]|nr:hypothetical protein [Chitinophagales bacterium]
MGLLSNLFGGAQGGMAAKLLQTLTSDLNLTPDQAEKIKGFFQQFREEKHEAKAEGDMASKMEGIKQEFKNHISSVLTSEQNQKFLGNEEKYLGMLHMGQ